MAKSKSKSAAIDETSSVPRQWQANRTGFVGLVLSIVQIVLHAGWIGITEVMAANETTHSLEDGGWQAWLIVAGVGVSTVTTMMSLFLSLHGSIHGRPRTPAIIGLIMSFFCGALITFVLLLTALAAGGTTA